MQRFDLYLLNQGGVVDRALQRLCPDDAAALAQAVALGHPHAVEVCQNKRVVGRVWPRPVAVTTGARHRLQRA